MQSYVHSFKRLNDYLEDKSVSIIGGAEINTELLDCADINVHINDNHWDYGRRDVLVTCSHTMASTEDIKSFAFIVVLQNGTYADEWNRAVIGAGRVLIPVWPLAHRTINKIGIEQERFSTFAKLIKTEPFTGILACKIVGDSLAKEIKISGFNFYKEPDGLMAYSLGSHKVMPNLTWLYNFARSDARVLVDEQLKDIFKIKFKEQNKLVRVRHIGDRSYLIDDLLERAGGI
jgi:hypothetical protein